MPSSMATFLLGSNAEGNIRTFSIASPPFEERLMIATRMRDRFQTSAQEPAARYRCQTDGPSCKSRQKWIGQTGFIDINMLANDVSSVQGLTLLTRPPSSRR